LVRRHRLRSLGQDEARLAAGFEHRDEHRGRTRVRERAEPVTRHRERGARSADVRERDGLDRARDVGPRRGISGPKRRRPGDALPAPPASRRRDGRSYFLEILASTSRLVRMSRSSPSTAISVPPYFEYTTRSPTATSTGMSSPECSERRPGPTASTS